VVVVVRRRINRRRNLKGKEDGDIWAKRKKNQKKGKNKMRTRGMRRKGEEKPRMRNKRMWRCRGEEDYECE
jgi:hypothetical protein